MAAWALPPPPPRPAAARPHLLRATSYHESLAWRVRAARLKRKPQGLKAALSAAIWAATAESGTAPVPSSLVAMRKYTLTSGGVGVGVGIRDGVGAGVAQRAGPLAGQAAAARSRQWRGRRVSTCHVGRGERRRHHPRGRPIRRAQRQRAPRQGRHLGGGGRGAGRRARHHGGRCDRGRELRRRHKCARRGAVGAVAAGNRGIEIALRSVNVAGGRNAAPRRPARRGRSACGAGRAAAGGRGPSAARPSPRPALCRRGALLARALAPQVCVTRGALESPSPKPRLRARPPRAAARRGPHLAGAVPPPPSPAPFSFAWAPTQHTTVTRSAIRAASACGARAIACGNPE
jgi:hypothetical protein